jgi:hypothetical protein
MPLQNRVDPFAAIFATDARGTLMGNRGGKFHQDDRTLGARLFVSRQWICCVLQFKDRQRDVWGRFYTELFFLDEVTALSAGHRPCFECRRADAQAFAQAWARGHNLDAPPRAPEMDRVLHEERLNGKAKRLHALSPDTLPDGAFIALSDGSAAAVRGDKLLVWSPSGYVRTEPRPRGGKVDVLTPPGILAALAQGYRPAWHNSATAIPAS